MTTITASEYTTKFIQEASLDPKSHKQLLWLWFFNPAHKTSVRLTKDGYTFMTNTLKLMSTQVKIDKPILAKVMIQLDRHIHSPYYVQNSKTIHFFGSEDALMLTLNGNNLEHYLSSIS